MKMNWNVTGMILIHAIVIILMLLFQSQKWNILGILFKYSGGKVWNEIPSHIQCATSVDNFEYLHKKHLH